MVEWRKTTLVDPFVEALAAIPVGEVERRPELAKRLGDGIDGLFRTEAASQFPSWPPGSTTDGCLADLCWRPDNQVLEVFGLTYLDFGPKIFPSRARFALDRQGRTSVTVFVGCVDGSDGPLSFVSRTCLFDPVWDEDDEGICSVDLIVGRRLVQVDWTKAVEWRETGSCS